MRVYTVFRLVQGLIVGSMLIGITCFNLIMVLLLEIYAFDLTIEIFQHKIDWILRLSNMVRGKHFSDLRFVSYFFYQKVINVK
jgi:hypothetical protein